MTGKQLPGDGSSADINIDRPYYLETDVVLADWVEDTIAQSDDDSFEDVFVSQKQNTSEFCERLNKQKLYPLTVFCLLQLLTANREASHHRLGAIIDQHKQWKIGYERPISDETYENHVGELVDAGVIREVEDGSTTKFGLPEGRDLAPAFDPANPDNALDRITMDDPIPSDNFETMLWPVLRNIDRPPIPAASSIGPIPNPWVGGLNLLLTGLGLTALYASTPIFGSPDLTTPAPALLWAVLSVGIAAMVVDALDQVRTGYQEVDNF
jgi:hypothetical protein